MKGKFRFYTKSGKSFVDRNKYKTLKEAKEYMKNDKDIVDVKNNKKQKNKKTENKKCFFGKSSFKF